MAKCIVLQPQLCRWHSHTDQGLSAAAGGFNAFLSLFLVSPDALEVMYFIDLVTESALVLRESAKKNIFLGLCPKLWVGGGQKS